MEIVVLIIIVFVEIVVATAVVVIVLILSFDLRFENKKKIFCLMTTKHNMLEITHYIRVPIYFYFFKIVLRLVLDF